MSESDAIDRVEDPVTVSALTADLHCLGVEAGDTLLVHSSLSALGWVCGDAPAVVDALMDVLTPTGTLVMPTHTTQYTDPTFWSAPPVPDHWVPQIRESMPPFRPAVTPSRGMGAVPECFRSYPGVSRSEHPFYSFAAWGADAETVVAAHTPDDGLGESSPLARVYDLGGKVLLLGVGHDRNTSLHLAEHRGDFPKERTSDGAPLVREGERVWVSFEDIEQDTEDFPEVGAAFERGDAVREGDVGAATAKLMAQPELVDFATEWFGANR
jgi:aminoglycoside 3-N-acetyltransferase